MKRLAILVAIVCLIPFSQAARADDPVKVLKDLHEDFQATLEKLDEDAASFRKQIRALRADLKELGRGKPVAGRPDLDLPCDCRPSVDRGCDAEFWMSKMGYTQTALDGLAKQGSASCVKIYEKFGSSLSTLPPSCEERVVGKQGVYSKFACGVVRRMAEKKLLMAQLADFEDRLRDIPKLKNDARAQLKEVKSDLKMVRDIGVNSKKAKTLPDHVESSKPAQSTEAGSARPGSNQ